VGLVATEALDTEPKTGSEDENEVYSKISIYELVESLKELLTHFEHRTNELKDLKEKYVDLLKQQEKTLLDLKEYEKELQSFDFICRTYEAIIVSFEGSYIEFNHHVKLKKNTQVSLTLILTLNLRALDI
jgi:hypothetical protein